LSIAAAPARKATLLISRSRTLYSSEISITRRSVYRIDGFICLSRVTPERSRADLFDNDQALVYHRRGRSSCAAVFNELDAVHRNGRGAGLHRLEIHDHDAPRAGNCQSIVDIEMDEDNAVTGLLRSELRGEPRLLYERACG